ncbi:MAG: Proposed precorrin-5* (C1)-methyltransferase @ Cobalt-precorrin-5B (C1)-methyltransferase [uncultured Craurococcus sp.]|uniref:Cobalt-precorrin-5B C(1)-methyltransferase n=1 Tax=uncultured Craurococcus sp. TaxID=1135998 RepID=A0A6J4HII9_9PROT|nr:MAG: Proposed precorrin-5* (C1)-methyltransferase @ Cobalt-precorrin-5B (C1)-methyltransferase [uncultured Craurococcus sp.]
MDAPAPLRRGWTTGACATAAAKAAFAALRSGAFPDPVTIALPGGGRPAFALARSEFVEGGAMAGVVKDAGDDPDVTHGALVLATVRPLPKGSGVRFRAGPGVGTVTRPGLPLPPGEPAINPVPRRMIQEALDAVAPPGADAEVEISIPGGEILAERTLNGRLGIVGGLSILGTTGIVVPYSCAAWIDSIHRGIDVARASGIGHVAGATGAASEAAVRGLHGLPDVALIEMGDFVGGMLKYLRRHPVARVSIAGGVAKMTKLAQGMLDLHSKRGTADMAALAALVGEHGLAERVRGANTVAEAFALAPGLGAAIAAGAWQVAAGVLEHPGIALEVVVFDREGRLMGRADFAPSGHAPSSPRKRR